MIYYDGGNLHITIEIWRVRNAVYRTINRIWLFLGRGYFWIDCGYCDRKNGVMKCRAPGPVPYDKPCVQEECGVFGEPGDE